MVSRSHPHSNTSWPATHLARLGRQLLLVPEAVLLLALLCLHSVVKTSPLIGFLGLFLIAWFGLRMGMLYAARRAIEQANYERAELFIRIVLWLYPFSADAHALNGTIALVKGNATSAVKAMQRAVTYYPFEPGLYVALSAALIEDNRPQAALDVARKALSLDPSCAPAYLHQASAEELLDVAPEMIEQHLRSGLAQQASPADEAALRCALADLLLSVGRITEAQLSLVGTEHLLDQCPASQRAGLHYHMGELLRKIGNADAARTHFSASETLDPHGRYAAAAWRAARS